MTSRSRALLAALSAFVCLSLLAQAQNPAEQRPMFSTRTDLVQIDVSVLDQNRRPIRGLIPADFVVTEDGKPQQISIFQAVDVPDPEPPPVEWMRDVTPDVTTNLARITRYWVVVVDDALIPGADPMIVKTADKVVRDLIDKFGPEDLATIIFTANSRHAQDFTNDRTKLLAALEGFSPHFAIWKLGSDSKRGVDYDWQWMTGSVNTVLNALDALAAIPNTRKGMLWVTPGVPVDFEMSGPVIAPVPPKPGDETMAGVNAHRSLIDRTKQIFEAAKLANVPIYPIDPTGLGGLSSPIVGAPAQKAVRSQDHMVMIAANTGGRTILNTNEFTQGIREVFEENASYYLLGYNPTNTRTDGTTRQIEVKVNRPGVTVRTKSGYVAAKPGAAPPAGVNNTLARAVGAPVPIRDLPLRAAVAPFAIPGSGKAAVVIALGIRQPAPEGSANERMTITTELRSTAYTTEGDEKGTQRHTAKVVLSPGATGIADYEALTRIDLAPGRYMLRLAAFQASADKTGTVSVDVLVPDFSRDAASMSGVVLNASPGRPSAPRDLFKDVLPVLPTAQRTFDGDDQVTAIFNLYQNAGKRIFPAAVAIRIVDDRGDTRMAESRSVNADTFVAPQREEIPTVPTAGGSRSAPRVTGAQMKTDPAGATVRASEFRYRLPLDRLTLGRYLLTFEATIGEARLRRDVRFEIRPN